MKTPSVELCLSLFIVLWHICVEDLLSSFIAFTLHQIVHASSPPGHLVLIKSVLSVEVVVCSVLDPYRGVNVDSNILTKSLNL